MNKKTRDRFFGVFVFLFITITTILSLIATGYRFNISWPINFGHLLQKTGTIALNTDPEGAKVVISGEEKKGLDIFSIFNKDKETITPIKIKNLLPGEYTVSFSLPGYWPYEKKVRVNATQTTFLENVILFKKSTALNILTAKEQEVIYSINNRYAWLPADKSIVDLDSGKIVYNNTTDKINWNDQEEEITDSSKVINLENSSINDYKQAINSPQEAQTQGNKIVYLDKDNLTIYNHSTKAYQAIPAGGEILYYKTFPREVWAIIKKDNRVKLESYSLDNALSNGSVDLLLESRDYELKLENSDTILLTDKDNDTLYIINSRGQLNLLSVLRGVNAYRWKGDGQLIYASGPEIYSYDIKQDKTWLINRLSDTINSLAWSANNYLIYSTSNNIGIIDLNDGRNDVTVIWTAAKISSLTLDDKNQILYFYGSTNQQDGLYKLGLR